MKKFLIIVALFSLISSDVLAAGFMSAPTAGNSSFYPMMQYQMEKQETLDFVNDPENYKEKRKKKDAQLDYIEGKTDVNPYITPTSLKNRMQYSKNVIQPQTMEFVRDENGGIKIKGSN